MDFTSSLQRFLGREYQRDFRWDKHLGLALKDFRQAINAENINAVIRQLENKKLYDFNGAFYLALQLFENLRAIESKADKKQLRRSIPLPEEHEWKFYLYLRQCSELFPEVILPEHKAVLEDSGFRRFFLIFRQMYGFFINATRVYLSDRWESQHPFDPLSEEEIAASDYAGEYRSFLRHFRIDGVLEVMKMSQEFLGFTTLNHVLGVHALAMKIARQLQAKGFAVDLAIVSATSINHDIGKFGCKGEEIKRVAYLHYYYTKEWFDRYNMPVLSHVAMNHGTWDLENIRLPIETIVLIYSDFCVKNRRNAAGQQEMSFFAIDEAFEVIKNMLDNLGAEKLARYQTVYEKLKDLDDLFSLLEIDRSMPGLEVDVDRIGYSLRYNPVNIVNANEFADIFAMLPDAEITLAYKNLSVAANFRVLHHLRDVSSLSHILEQARLEKNWRDLRTYLRIIEDYSDYFTHEQRILTIDFLFELLHHSEDDVRYRAAMLIAKNICNIDPQFHKELPEHAYVTETRFRLAVFARVLDLLDYDPDNPDENSERLEQHIYNTTIIIDKLFRISTAEDLAEYKEMLLALLPGGKAKYEQPLSILYLAEIFLFTYKHYRPAELKLIMRFILRYLHYPEAPTRLMVYNLIETLLAGLGEDFWHNRLGKWPQMIVGEIGGLIRSGTSPAEVDVLQQIISHIPAAQSETIDGWESMLQRLDYIVQTHRRNYRAIFLDDFKTKTSWVIKKNNCDFLARFARELYEKRDNIYQSVETVSHFANLLKVSRVEGTRFRAGQRLLELLPNLEITQVNELAIDLLRSLEQDDEGYTQYMPPILGHVITYLPPDQFAEIIADMSRSVRSNRINIRELLIKTIGYVVLHLGDGRPELKSYLPRLLSLLVSAVFDLEEQVAKSAYFVFGTLLLSPDSPLGEAEKRDILERIGKKFITLIRNRSDSIISLFYSSACLNSIYRFISQQEKGRQPLHFPRPEHIAFIPGTFDPFSNGHRELVQHAVDKGYEVFVQVDEYSWSKRTLPRLLRKQMVRIAIADLLNVFLYPHEPPLNLATNDNLQRLAGRFAPRRVTLVIGTDVIMGASAYRHLPRRGEASIFDFHHLIFLRPKSRRQAKVFSDYFVRVEKLKPYFRNGYDEVILGSEVSMISSSRIRESIEAGKSIDDMVDPVVARFITERRLYVRTPEYKSEIGQMAWRYRLLKADNFADKELQAITDLYQNAFSRHPARSIPTRGEIVAYFRDFIKRKNARILILENIQRGNELIGFLAYFELESVRLLALVQSPKVSALIREATAGPLVYTNIMAIKPSYRHRNLAFDLKTRAALIWIEEGYMFALSKINLSILKTDNNFGAQERRLEELNEEMGYTTLPIDNEEKVGAMRYRMRYMIANLQRPVLLINDLIDQFKNPYHGDRQLQRLIQANLRQLSDVFRHIFPGNLLLRINNRDLVAKLVERLCELNEVPFRYGHGTNRQLGQHMAILLGQVLGREVVPNTISKAFHADRTIDRRGEKSEFMPFPYYTGLRTQMLTMKNFARSPILADLFSLSGQTLMHLIDMARSIDLPVAKVLVGIITGQARELLHANRVETHYLIHLPRLTNWFNLRHFYPFIGGETINQPFYYRKVVLESMNYIFPYRRALQLQEVPREQLLMLSQVCLDGSRDIFAYFEAHYLQQYKRELTLAQLPEIMEDPRRPIHNPCYEVDWNEKITRILAGDLEQLDRYHF
jgi:nicotinic acid mononucleotide adenylyltransferase